MPSVRSAVASAASACCFLFCVFLWGFSLPRIFLFLSSLFWRVSKGQLVSYHSVYHYHYHNHFSLITQLREVDITSTSQHHYYHYHRELERAQPPPGVYASKQISLSLSTSSSIVTSNLVLIGRKGVVLWLWSKAAGGRVRGGRHFCFLVIPSRTRFMNQ